ncbi:gas vesicle protein [Actinopolymorpha rutila]
MTTRRGADPMRVSRTAMEQLSALTNCEAAGVSRLENDGDGWIFQVEIIEVPRVPDTTSILASYETHTDSAGNITSYRRQRRYPRNQAGEM